MTSNHPRVRIHTRNGHVLNRDVLTFTFFMHQVHAEIAADAHRSINSYLRSIGPGKIALYADMDGEWQEFDSAGKSVIEDRLNEPVSSSIHLAGADDNHASYGVNYRGISRTLPMSAHFPDSVSVLSFRLPTEHLDEDGPGWVHNLAMALASTLPFCFGQAGLSVGHETSGASARKELLDLCFRHPGMDMSNVEWCALHIGTHVRASSWMTFLGNPVLGELGGVAGLKAQLHTPGTTVQEMEHQRAVITLGPWPEAGDLDKGQVLPAYRELARVLEPWLYHEPKIHAVSDMTDTRRWERRFLD